MNYNINNNFNYQNFNLNANNNFINNNISQALTEKSKRMNLNNNPFKIKLKPHQEALLYKVLDVDEKVSFSNVPYGVMSDKPGSGKTYVVLAMIYFAIKFLNSKGANIIVVPHNIYTQWVNSIKKFLGELLTFKLLLEYSDINLLYTNPSMLYQHDIILTTSLYYDTFASTVSSLKLNVRRTFFDEADTIKNLLAHSMPCAMTWFISASIKRVFDQKTNTATIGSYKLHLNQLLNNECFCSAEFIDSNIVLPKPNFEYFKCKDFYLDNILTNILTREQLSYINGHDYSNIRTICGNANIKETKDIVENLYINTMKNLHDVNEQIKEIEKKLKYCYNQEEKNKYLETKDKLTIQQNNFENITNQIKNLAMNLNLCINCFKKLKSQENINKNTFKIEFYLMECNLGLCNQCYIKEIKNELLINENTPIEKIKIKCLNCKNHHLVESLKYNTEEFSFNKKELELENMNKLKIMEKILEICGKKIIIYSQFRGVNSNIKTLLSDNYGYLQLDGGNIKDLDNILDNFRNNNKINILLIDDTSFGVGLNIEYTTDIIFFNYIEPKIKEQLIGRAQRLGRTSKLNIWELLYANET
jgi:hypothetical protein